MNKWKAISIILIILISINFLYIGVGMIGQKSYNNGYNQAILTIATEQTKNLEFLIINNNTIQSIPLQSLLEILQSTSRKGGVE